jgi:chloramphenicol O-acetyltransferase
MESIISSIRQLLDELEEKIQMISRDQQTHNSKYKDIDAKSQEDIKDYVKELIRERNNIKENKINQNKDTQHDD